MTFRPTHIMTIPVRLDEYGDFWYSHSNFESGCLDARGLNYTSLEPIPRTFEVNDCVVMQTARDDVQRVVWTIIGIDGKNVWLRRQGSTSVLYNTARTDAMEHAQ